MHKQLNIAWGVKVVALERAATGLALLAVAFAPAAVISLARVRTSVALAPQLKVLLFLAGVFVLVTAVGLWKRKKWGWGLMVLQVVVAMMASVVGTSFAAASWPSQLGRWWVAGFVAGILLCITALVVLLIGLFQIKWFFSQEEDEDFHKGSGRLLIVAVCVLVAVRIAAWGALDVTYSSAPAGAGGEENISAALTQSLAYCETQEEGVKRDSCFTQVAIAAASAGDTLPPDFCDSVSPESSQLKFLCIAYARQPESCNAFESIRQQALCRALVTGNVEECAAIESVEEQELCRQMVVGYLEEVRKEIVGEPSE
ncbi:MAG: hypothetical protein WC659_03425 [Patescibacteria group bacterium]